MSLDQRKNLISTYIHAKDNNKPHLMKNAFAQSASLIMNVNTDNISFPANASGLQEITHILVTDFSRKYNNVYTLCLTDSVNNHTEQLSCKWLVGMSGQDGENVRVGFGDYIWRFGNLPEELVTSLTITIKEMHIIPTVSLDQITDWLSSLPYPWCDRESLLEKIPALDSLNFIRTGLAT